MINNLQKMYQNNGVVVTETAKRNGSKSSVRISKKYRDKIVGALLSGVSISNVATRYSVSEKSVYFIIRERNLYPSMYEKGYLSKQAIAVLKRNGTI